MSLEKKCAKTTPKPLELKLGDKVKCKAAQSPWNGVAGKGTIALMAFQNGGTSGPIYYQVKMENGQNYNHLEATLSVPKTQTLYAFQDCDEEVHWSTKNYSEKEQEEAGYEPRPEFNKVIDLE